MKTDRKAGINVRERAKGKTLEQTAAQAELSVSGLRRDEQRGNVPGRLREPRASRTLARWRKRAASKNVHSTTQLRGGKTNRSMAVFPRRWQRATE